MELPNSLVMAGPTVLEIADEVRAGRLTARAAVERSLARIEQVQPQLNAFSLVLQSEASRS